MTWTEEARGQPPSTPSFPDRMGGAGAEKGHCGLARDEFVTDNIVFRRNRRWLGDK